MQAEICVFVELQRDVIKKTFLQIKPKACVETNLTERKETSVFK